ncbi:uncharacterized protein EI97DRAFT_445391 [Westerdykella ornata]|uniref:Uncharacterized protein n=1 Tax=Westerdykella ornata TaxID=318751 RepID=A0A6A6J8Q3_WESOR|nr:uncharacterized protein EI97DRAFT_445391 [Westerdykella ornata]KAF2272941.1 hypothetical protein EI97DRAFT_445391 [Westerdykella ornata]
MQHQGPCLRVPSPVLPDPPSEKPTASGGWHTPGSRFNITSTPARSEKHTSRPIALFFVVSPLAFPLAYRHISDLTVWHSFLLASRSLLTHQDASTTQPLKDLAMRSEYFLVSYQAFARRARGETTFEIVKTFRPCTNPWPSQGLGSSADTRDSPMQIDQYEDYASAVLVLNSDKLQIGWCEG